METKIGAGLIEEVIQVAEGELKLVDVMTQAKVYVLFSLIPFLPTLLTVMIRWEDLEEKPVEGQWTYFERKSA